MSKATEREEKQKRIETAIQASHIKKIKWEAKKLNRTIGYRKARIELTKKYGFRGVLAALGSSGGLPKQDDN